MIDSNIKICDKAWLDSDLGLAYLAGFFDGEGCVYIGTNGGINCRIVNTGLPVLKAFKFIFGGSILNRKQKVNKQQFVWSVYGEEAELFMEHMLRFSIEKLPQLQTALMWLIARKELQAINQGYCKGKKKHKDKEDTLSNFRSKLSRLKKEGFDAI